MTLTPELLAELRRLAMAATPGPWSAHKMPRNPYDLWDICSAPDRAYDGGAPVFAGTCGRRTEENARYIAAADPAVVLVLLDRIAETDR